MIKMKWFKVLSVFVLATILLACGHDNLHVQHRQLHMLWNDEFDALEESLTHQYALLKNRKLKPSDFALQMQTIEYANNGVEQHFERYVQAKPESKWAHLLYGIYLVRQAASERGSRNYVDTSQGQINKMHQLLLRAMPLLKKARRNQASIGLYASGWIRTQMFLGSEAVSSDDEMRDLVQEALARDGEIWGSAYAYQMMLYPQWGGSEQAMLHFINQVKVGHPILADSLQADFYWSRGIRHASRGNIQQAVSAHEKAVSIYPHSFALNALAEHYMQLNRCDDAVDVANRNLEENNPWDLYTIELAMQANRCAGNRLKADRLSTKRAKLIYRYRNGK